MRQFAGAVFLLLLAFQSFAQQDSVYIPVKIRHAEPLYIDLIRDLGARKGEKEWNVGWASENQKEYTGYTAFAEYEFAPVNRLGFEVEVPIKFYHVLSDENSETGSLRNRIEGIKLATQYTFLVSEADQLSMAAGYIHEFKVHSFQTITSDHAILKGNEFNPFLIIAKRFGSRVHTLVYTGPVWEQNHTEHSPVYYYQVNTSIHYMLPSKNFIGVELNEEFASHTYEIVARPQIKISMASNLAIGFATGIPVHSKEHGMSFLARLILEPMKK